MKRLFVRGLFAVCKGTSKLFSLTSSRFYTGLKDEIGSAGFFFMAGPRMFLVRRDEAGKVKGLSLTGIFSISFELESKMPVRARMNVFSKGKYDLLFIGDHRAYRAHDLYVSPRFGGPMVGMAA